MVWRAFDLNSFNRTPPIYQFVSNVLLIAAEQRKTLKSRNENYSFAEKKNITWKRKLRNKINFPLSVSKKWDFDFFSVEWSTSAPVVLLRPRVFRSLCVLRRHKVLAAVGVVAINNDFVSTWNQKQKANHFHESRDFVAVNLFSCSFAFFFLFSTFSTIVTWSENFKQSFYIFWHWVVKSGFFSSLLFATKKKSKGIKTSSWA